MRQPNKTPKSAPCGFCKTMGGTHQKGCPNLAKLGDSRTRAVIDYRNGFIEGKRGYRELNGSSQFYKLGYKLGSVQSS